MQQTNHWPQVRTTSESQILLESGKIKATHPRCIQDPFPSSVFHPPDFPTARYIVEPPWSEHLQGSPRKPRPAGKLLKLFASHNWRCLVSFYPKGPPKSLWNLPWNQSKYPVAKFCGFTLRQSNRNLGGQDDISIRKVQVVFHWHLRFPDAHGSECLSAK